MSDAKTDVIESGIARLLDQFKGSPNLLALLTAYLTQVQELESAAWALLNERSIQNATGDRLDGLGEIVKVKRAGRNDATYRAVLIAEFAALSSDGTAEDLLEIAQLLIQMPTADYELKEYYPKTIYLRPVDFPFTGDSYATTNFLRRVTPAGTHLLFVYAPAGATGYDEYLFQFSSSGAASETDAAQGFANNAQTTGGRLSGTW